MANRLFPASKPCLKKFDQPANANVWQRAALLCGTYRNPGGWSTTREKI